ncbi:MAG: hypothetical protein N2050_05685 [Flavobacteriales bacterium]|nr:hypothetical protein [Flavobacteriales bacterium]MCX7650027.1 hypothetical protein [Flavobacteriales bacterium]MDW8432361.1 hypothetical protein [Flavobacteriales bacterium]
MMPRNRKFLRRLFLYLTGVALGSLLSYFLLFRGRQFPAFWPQGIVLEKLGKARYLPHGHSDSLMHCLKLDTTAFKKNLPDSRVIFRRSLPRRVPCPVYALRQPQWSHCLLLVALCDSTYTLYDVRSPEGLSQSCHQCTLATRTE